MMKRAIAIAAMMALHACGPTVGNDTDVAAAVGNGMTIAGAMQNEAGDTLTTVIEEPDAIKPGASDDQQTRVEDLTGDWKITAVNVAPGPVQAVSKDDPALLGAVLSISPERMVWKPHKGSTFTDACEAPQIGPDDVVGCAQGRFGPRDTKLTEGRGTIVIDWYDGAILTLTRQ